MTIEQDLTERDQLDADILTRLELQRTMAEHTRPVLQLEFGIAQQTVADIESGATDRRKLRTITPEVIGEVRKRRTIWSLANERMQDYTIDALARKHGSCATNVVRRIRAVRERVNAAARAERVYGRRIAA